MDGGDKGVQRGCIQHGYSHYFPLPFYLYHSPNYAGGGQAFVVAARDLRANTDVEPRSLPAGALLAQDIGRDIEPASRRTMRAIVGVLLKHLICQR